MDMKFDDEKYRGLIRTEFNRILKSYAHKNTLDELFTKLKEFVEKDVIDCVTLASSEKQKRGAKKKFTDEESRERKKLANNSESARIKRREYARKRRAQNA